MANKKNPEIDEETASDYVFQIISTFGYRWILEEIAGDANSSGHDVLKDKLEGILNNAEAADDSEEDETSEPADTDDESESDVEE